MPAIEVTSLHKRYGERIAVDDVSFTVETGEIFGIVGRNGAGKTTTVECVTGLRAPDAGTVTVLGLDPRKDRDQVRRRVGVQLQESRLPDKLTVDEALGLYAAFYPDPADVDGLVDELGLASTRGTAYGKLSGGQRQRVSVALALVGNPEIAVLDELTTGLDPQARRETWSLVEGIRDRGVTVLLVTHFMEEAQRLCDRVAIIDAGRVTALDTPDGLVARLEAEQRVRFQVADAFDAIALEALPEVRAVDREGEELVVSGHGDLLFAVTGALAGLQIRPVALRLDRATLDDAFLALTGRPADASEPAPGHAPETTGASS